MAHNKDLKKIRAGIRLDPQATAPTNAEKGAMYVDSNGDLQISDGFQQAAEEEEYHVGQKVMITEGPFNNFNGVIDEISRERKKLKVLGSIFGRPTPVEVEFDKVKNV